MRRFFITVILLVLLTAASVFTYEYFFKSKKNPDKLTLYGNVDVRQVDISFRVAGQVTDLFFEEGDVVPKGSLMAILDQSPYDSQTLQAAANVKTIKANLYNAEILLKRRLELISDGGVSQEDLNNAQSAYDQLLSELNASEAALSIASDNLRYIKAYAPTDGIILTRIREPGSVVRESDPVYTLSIASPVWIRAFVDETHLGQVNYGMNVEITTDNPDGHSYSGKVGFISPMAEFTPKTVETTQLRTDLVYRLRIYVDKPDSGLRQGMPVTAKLNLKQHE
ncbi:MAG: efflux RND transporter periplasmic adaptor subunit [Parachlamydiaceae bacterium]